LKYDLASAEKDFYKTGYFEGAGPLAALVLLELKSAYSQLYQWTRRYTTPILDGKISVEEATKDFLLDPIFKPYW
jgi:hypothetical protein